MKVQAVCSPLIVGVEAWESLRTAAERMRHNDVDALATESVSLELLLRFLAAHGKQIAGPHEEEYLSPPGGPEQRTIIRYAVVDRGEEEPMKADVGDEIVVEAVQMGGHKRKGLVLEVLGGEGHKHFRVRWDDNGHESIFFPGPDATVVHLHTAEARPRRG